MVTWEYPPLVVGGIAAHVEGLSQALVRDGHDVAVLTLHHPDAPDDSMVDGVRVLRARSDLPWLPPEDFVARMASANHHLVQLAARLDSWRPDVVHAHDWLVAWAGDTLRTIWGGVPFIATIHATERGRNGGHVPPGPPAAISAVEWWLTFLARRVICCSHYMVGEVIDGFHLPPDKIDMVPNGVDPARWAPPDPAPRRGEHAPLFVSWGRIQYEKGFQTLVGAMPMVRAAAPGARCVIAGRGSSLADLQHLSRDLGVQDCVDLPGFVPDDELLSLLHRSTAAVIPSLYEPFGIVALEAMAAGAPVVAAASGGLREVIDDGQTGLLFPPGDGRSLANALIRVLHEPGLGERLAGGGLAATHGQFSWDAVARQTVETYRKVVPAQSNAPAAAARTRAPRGNGKARGTAN
jgi:glycogen(starch) synthase